MEPKYPVTKTPAVSFVPVVPGCNRRSFLGTLLALFAGAPLVNAVARRSAPAARSVVLNKVYVAGFQYYDGPSLLGAGTLAAGEPIILIGEPENPHDAFAVRLEVRGRKIGYVPRAENHHLSRLLRAEVSLRASVLAVNPANPAWQQVRVEVAMES